ncbi:hypothetical protein BJV82DRAFT_573079 [Fennellomyces sp. T-0311]|nr:hypothetical protein BJV82DRAFT_573079 [Fennellomyces sp. T-0311]
MAQKGSYQLAIEILEVGLRVTRPSDWPVHYDKREEARQSTEAKIDFIFKLPSEVIHWIFAYLRDYPYNRPDEDIMTSVMTLVKNLPVSYMGSHQSVTKFLEMTSPGMLPSV